MKRKKQNISTVHTSDELAQLDVLRRERTLIPEIIFCENKTIDQVLNITSSFYKTKQFALGSRCPESYYPKLRRHFPSILINESARCFRVGKPLECQSSATVGILAAGTTDTPVCEEAAFVLNKNYLRCRSGRSPSFIEARRTNP